MRVITKYNTQSTVTLNELELISEVAFLFEKLFQIYMMEDSTPITNFYHFGNPKIRINE